MPNYEFSFVNPQNTPPWYNDRLKINKVVIKEGVTNIGDQAFQYCSGLTSVTIPNSVTNIGESAFYYCSGLTSITIPKSVTNIRYWTFQGCSGLTSITIPNSVTSIGEDAFKGCSGLTSIIVEKGNTNYDSRDNCNAIIETKSNTLINGCKNTIIPNSVTGIGNNAFYNCSGLTSITIPNSVTSIGSYTFENCSGLTSITIPNSVTSIGWSAFEGCSSLTSITIPNSVTSIGNSAFEDCKGLTSITIPNSVTSIGGRAFSGCSGLTSITIPNSVTSIGYDSFAGCRGLTSITIPNSVTSIESSVFTNCSGLTSITIPNSVTKIGDFAFSGCSGLTSVTIPNSVKSIGNGGFQYCSGLTSITIPNSVTKIGDFTFKYCSGLTSITIPNSVTSIGYDAFYDCSSLTSITIPNSVTSIGNYTFENCSGLTSITIPNSVWRIGGAAFYGCSSLTSITIPNSVKNIESSAFENCINLKKVTIEVNKDLSYWELFAESALEELIMMGDIFPKSTYNDFASGLYEKTTLYVPSSLYDKYRSTSPWGKFVNIMTIEQRDEANKVAANPVIAKINAIGKVEYTEACKDKIDDASDAYEALTDDQKAFVTNLDVLTTAQQTYDDLKAAAEKLAADKTKADAVIAKITAIGKVEYTDACKDKIDEANNAYNALNADQKVLVTNLDVLTKAQQTYDNLKAAADKLAADKAKADPVIAKIAAIGKVEYTYACKDKIDEANNAYNALTADQKALVTNVDVLTTAKQTYDNLKATADKLAADKAKADPVIAKINAIGKVEYTYACKDKIDEANNAYNALTNDQKALVTNVVVLTTAKQTYDNLRAAAEKLIADKAAFDKYKSEIIAIIEALVKDDDSDAVKDIIRKAISNIDALEYDAVITLDDNKAKIQSFVTYIDETVENQRVEDQKTNGIEELEFAEKYNIYDLNGRKITNSILKSGLYIRNGKKMVVK